MIPTNPKLYKNPAKSQVHPRTHKKEDIRLQIVFMRSSRKGKQSSMLRLAIWGQQYPEFDGRYIRHICALDDEEGNESRFKFAEYGHMNK